MVFIVLKFVLRGFVLGGGRILIDLDKDRLIGRILGWIWLKKTRGKEG